MLFGAGIGIGMLTYSTGEPLAHFSNNPDIIRGLVEARTAEAVRPAALRRLRINKADLEEHGYTEDCPQCTHTRRYGKPRAGGAHTDACRERLTTAIGQSEAGQA